MYGQFSCANLDCQFGSVNTVGIAPESPNDYPDGLSVIDLNLIQAYLNTGTGFDNYNKIAADADNDKTIDTDDKDAITDVILGVASSFPADSWRFVMNTDKSSFEGATYVNSYNYVIDDGYNGEYTVSGLSESQINSRNWDIRAIKVGDLNGSHPEIRASVAPAKVSTNAILAGEEVELLFTADYFTGIQAYQFGVQIDPAYLEVLAFESADLPQFSAKNFGDRIKEKGELRTLWYEKTAQPISLPNGAALFKMKVRALQAVDNLQKVLQIQDSVLPMEFVSNGRPINDVELSVKLIRNEFPVTTKEVLVYPNPTAEVSKIGFVIDTPTEVNLTLHDVNGRLLKNYTTNFSAGYNEFVLENLSDFSTGLLFFTLDTGIYTAKGKIIKK